MRPARASILLVDSDPEATRAIVDGLEAADYRVWHAVDGREARLQLTRAQPDLVLLDLLLPDVDGLVLCGVLKSMADVPIIICTGSVRRSDPVLALKLGADDFIKKPCEIDDLLVRVEVVLRRSPRRSATQKSPLMPSEIRLGSLVLEPLRRRARVGDEQLTLTRTEFRLLVALASRPAAIVSRDQLADEVWGYSDVSNSRTIDVHIRRLRVKLGQCRVPGPAILSVRGMGYRITVDAAAITAA